MAFAPGRHLGPYEIVSAIGAGGMGEVYRARDPRLARDVAIKLVPASFASDPDRLARFTREALLLAGLNHPNVASVYGLEELEPGEGPPALIMELVEGPTLAERIAAGPVPLDEALPIARQIADALEYAHDLGVIHRDLKPANIKLRPDGTVKVLDFGLAKALDRAPAVDVADASNTPTFPAQNTEAGVILGTPGYMAPEQARGRAVDKRGDIWAFGVVLFEMLSGRHPFAGSSATEMMAAVMRDEPPWHALPDSTPLHVRTLLRRCLDRDPKQRLRDIGEARVLLEQPLDDDHVTSARGPTARRTWSSFIWPAAAGLFALVALIAMATLLKEPEAPSRFPVQFTIAPPTQAAWNQQNLTLVLAVSPNGQQIASVVPDGIWLWSAESGTARLLDDTAGAAAPFFSPDGNHIAFFARDELRRIAVSGGPASVITRATAGSAGTWGQDDTILYSRWLGADAGLWHVPARGGEPRLLVPGAKPEDLRAFPVFLPDGRHYAFLKGASALPVGQRHICIGSLDDAAEAVCVAQGDSNPAYSPTGHLIFVRAGTLVALPFDTERRQATGAAMTLARGARWFGPIGVAVFGLSADGHVLVHATAPRPRRLIWFDRSGNQVGQVGAPGMYNMLQLSPEGRRAAVDIWNNSNGGRDLWVVDLASGDPSRVTFDPVDVHLGAWAPGGRSLIYARPAPGPPDLYEVGVDGAPLRTVLAAPGVQLAQDWSSDGNWIAYLELSPDRLGERRVWLLPRNGEPRRLRQTPANTFDPRFSPDSRLLAFVSDESGRPEVYVTPIQDGSPARRLSRAGGFLPRWRGDGRELFFLQLDGTLMTVDPAAEPSQPKPLFQVDGVSVADAYSPPRERFAVYDVTRDGQRFLMRLPEAADDRADDLRVWIDWAAVQR